MNIVVAFKLELMCIMSKTTREGVGCNKTSELCYQCVGGGAIKGGAPAGSQPFKHWVTEVCMPLGCGEGIVYVRQPGLLC